MSAKTYTTREAAAKIGVSRQTLQTWISRRKVRAPQPISLGNATIRLWSEEDIRRLRQIKQEIYLRAVGRPPKTARKQKRC